MAVPRRTELDDNRLSGCLLVSICWRELGALHACDENCKRGNGPDSALKPARGHCYVLLDGLLGFLVAEFQIFWAQT